jgi:formylglycine-generating enzyme required for sulfatase activity
MKDCQNHIPSTQERQPFEPHMLHIPAGPFLMGTSDQQIEWLAQNIQLAKKWKEKGFFSREQPQHTVSLSDYHIGKYPVTVGKYISFIQADGYQEHRFWTEAGWAWCREENRTQPNHWDDGKWSGDQHLPVVGVSWYEAYAYCQWLSDATGRTYHLSSEAQWEKAARGMDGRQFPWGNQIDTSRSNTRASGLEKTLPVGGYSPAGDSPYGCVGMTGNVSEWTQTKFIPYPYHAADGRDDPAGEFERTTRGGSWHSLVLRARTVSRGMNDPFFTDTDLGFRCACSC